MKNKWRFRVEQFIILNKVIWIILHWLHTKWESRFLPYFILGFSCKIKWLEPKTETAGITLIFIWAIELKSLMNDTKSVGIRITCFRYQINLQKRIKKYQILLFLSIHLRFKIHQFLKARVPKNNSFERDSVSDSDESKNISKLLIILKAVFFLIF